MNIDIFADIIGNIGVVFFLAGYYLLQRGTISHASLTYLGLNLVGSLLLLGSLAIHWNLAAFLLEAAWALISIMGIIHYYRKQRGP